jgi:hypothetical protein
MENKTEYSLQDAKDEVSKKFGYANIIEGIHDRARMTNRFTITELVEGVAELYKEKSTEDLREENEWAIEELNKVRMESHLRKLEIERLTQSNKELVETISILGEEICNLKETK